MIPLKLNLQKSAVLTPIFASKYWYALGALDEIYNMYIILHGSDLKHPANVYVSCFAISNFKNDFLNFSLSAIFILEIDTILKKDEESKVLIIQVIISFASLSASSRSRLAKKGFRSPKQANGGGPPRLAPQQFAHLAPIDCFGGD